MSNRRGSLSRINIDSSAIATFVKPEQPTRSSEAHVPVTLKGGVFALAPVELADIISQLAEKNHPAYVEIESGVVQVLLIPVPYRVVRLTPPTEAGVGVTLHISHAKHVLPRDHPRFEDLLHLLRDAQATGQTVLVTEEPDSNEIVDVAPVDSDNSQSKLLPDTSAATDDTLEFKEDETEFVPRTLDAKSTAATATDLFKFLAEQPQIPFKYPRDGCWARASEMCRLLSTKGVASRKVWLYRSDMDVDTVNDPACSVTWVYHVAPFVNFKQADGTSIGKILDPSLFSAPVSRTDWERQQLLKLDKKKRLVNNPASRNLTPSAVFFRSCNGATMKFDPKFEETQKDLALYRLKLATQIQKNGPPPYKCPKI